MSNVKDMSLADEGIRKIKWVQKHMPVLEHIKKQFEEEKPFEGITIGSCLHLEPKTVNLGLTLQAGGAEVAMTGCNPLSTHDDAAAGAAALGLHIYGWREQTDEEYYEAIDMKNALNLLKKSKEHVKRQQPVFTDWKLCMLTEHLNSQSLL